MPLLHKQDSGLPVIYRIGTRGDCTSVRSDVSSLELYTVRFMNKTTKLSAVLLDPIYIKCKKMYIMFAFINRLAKPIINLHCMLTS